ncbi:MAG: conserved phage C-terminal domain-containing protein [Clostridia bacterium]|nr:conserved phage C-terminal domain-containing protein [Clostridia bacterium]
MGNYKDHLESYNVYVWMNSLLGLKGTELHIFAVIFKYIVENGVFLYDPRTIEVLSGTSRPTIIKTLKRLEDAEILVSINDGEIYDLGKSFFDNMHKNFNAETFKIFKLRNEERNKEKENKEKRTKKENKELETNKEVKKYNSAHAHVREVTKEVITYLNKICGTSYRATSTATMAYISGRLSEGYTVDDLKKVIDKQYKKWHGTEYAMYLRPDTLFRPMKFDVYLNAPDVEVRKTAESGVSFTDGGEDLEGII